MGRREARRARHGAAAARVRDFISQPERRGRGRGARRVAALRSRAVYCQQTVSVGPSDGPVVGPEARQPCPTMGWALAHDAPGQSSLRQARGCSSSVVSCGIGARWWLESEGLKRSAGQKRKSEREATAHRRLGARTRTASQRPARRVRRGTRARPRGRSVSTCVRTRIRVTGRKEPGPLCAVRRALVAEAVTVVTTAGPSGADGPQRRRSARR